MLHYDTVHFFPWWAKHRHMVMGGGLGHMSSGWLTWWRSQELLWLRITGSGAECYNSDESWQGIGCMMLHYDTVHFFLWWAKHRHMVMGGGLGHMSSGWLTWWRSQEPLWLRITGGGAKCNNSDSLLQDMSIESYCDAYGECYQYYCPLYMINWWSTRLMCLSKFMHVFLPYIWIQEPHHFPDVTHVSQVTYRVWRIQSHW
jgi:hypothetical protein